MRTFPHLLCGLCLCAISSLFFSSGVSSQPRTVPGGPPAASPPRLPDGISREGMWPAPTTEDWAKPCLIPFQRTWEDAVAVAEETQRAILICVNMDGEIASEHYAGIRYRRPDTASLYDPYVCVIASVYRHSPRDHDDEGRRILCPRFGSVTCGEHITIEPILYEKYFEGDRISPRHIMIELDGSEVYDIFHAWDTSSVFTTIVDGITNREIQGKNIVRGDRPVLERVDSRDNADRTAIERAYLEGDATTRRALLLAAAEHDDKAHMDLLRLGVFSFDVELSRLARSKLAESRSESAIDLIPEALRMSLEEKEREALLEALARLGEASQSERAQWVSVVHRGLATRSKAVNVEGLTAALTGAEYPASVGTVEVRADKLKVQDEGSVAEVEDSSVLLEKAETALYLGLEGLDAFGASPRTENLMTSDPATARLMTRSRLSEARRIARAAEEKGASGWRLDSINALSTYYLGDAEAAYPMAEKAVESMVSGGTDWVTMAVLTVFAEGRFKSIKAAVRAEKRWPPRWLTDVHSAYVVLLQHPLTTDSQIVWHYDFLTWLGADVRRKGYLQKGLERFPESWILHDRLRARILEKEGSEGLEPAYDRMLEVHGESSSLLWFAGLASFQNAEYLRRAQKQDDAADAYSRSIARYDKAIALDPSTQQTADPYVALALAGRARLAFEGDNHETAVDLLLESFERHSASAATLDGLTISPVDTAKMVRAKLGELGRKELNDRLQAGLDKLDPSQLELPAYERDVPGRRGRGGC